jgi:hypothetical protein
MAATTVMSVNAVTDANLRTAAITLTGAIKQNYDRAAMLQRTQRIVFDIDHHTWWVEYTDNPFALHRERATGEEGESLEERQSNLEDAVKALEDDTSFESDQERQVKLLVEGGTQMFFVPDADLDFGKPQPLPGGVGFSRIWTGHQEEAFKAGLTQLHFFPQGWTEPALIELVDEGGDIFTLEVQPLTGRVRSYREERELPDLEDYDGFEEGDL